MTTASTLVVLGAGVPADHGGQMSLRRISDRTPLDWQLSAFESFVDEVHFVGGYRLPDVMERYPSLNYSYNSGWRTSGPTQSLFSVVDQLGDVSDLWVVYSDVIVSEALLRKVQYAASEASIVLATEESPQETGAEHSLGRKPETVFIGGNLREFVGMLRLDRSAVRLIQGLDGNEREKLKNQRLSGLVDYLLSKDWAENAVLEVSATGDWVHVEDPNAVARFVMQSKAVALSRIAGRLRTAKVADLWYISRGDWKNDAEDFVSKTLDAADGRTLIARSSAVDEDGFNSTNAGVYESVLDVPPTKDALLGAIEQVFSSYGNEFDEDQVLVQPMIANVQAAGVAFTRQMNNGAPYYTLSFSRDGKTNSVTGGEGQSEDWTIFRFAPPAVIERLPKIVRKVLFAIQEVEQLTEYDRLDIEFATTLNNDVYILQVRPLAVEELSAGSFEDAHTRELVEILHSDYFDLTNGSGEPRASSVVWSNMADWNPAEILGAQPGKLAFDLYRYLVTDEVWCTQRREVGGVADNTPLMRRLGAQVFIDVQASLRSFVPSTLDKDIRERVVRYGLDRLINEPHLHDKVEFEVIPTCVGFDFEDWHRRWVEHDVLTTEESDHYKEALLGVTSQTVERLERDLAELRSLDRQFDEMGRSSAATWERANQYLAICRQKGTLHFAHLARAGFVAVSFLNSAQARGLVSAERLETLRQSIGTVSTDLDELAQRVRSGLDGKDVLSRKYGHLRAGTYDISAPTYRSDPERYFASFLESESDTRRTDFSWTPEEEKQLDRGLAEAGFQFRSDRLLSVIQGGVQGREYGKFVFTKFLSKALDIYTENLAEIGVSLEEARHIPLATLQRLGLETVTAGEAAEMLKVASERERERYDQLRRVLLPSCITEIDQLFAFKRTSVEPNFVTNEKGAGVLVVLEPGTVPSQNLKSCIVAIRNADPGYDYLFGLGIAGLVTAYGGPNSHMAIRANERALPAVIGVGEDAFMKLKSGRQYRIDCPLRFFGLFQVGDEC